MNTITREDLMIQIKCLRNRKSEIDFEINELNADKYKYLIMKSISEKFKL